MAGGTFVTHTKVRPGFYHRFVATVKKNLLGATGVMAMPLELDWGPMGLMELDVDMSDAEIEALYGRKLQGLPLLREAFKEALKVYVYRVGGGDRAVLAITQDDMELTATARYHGARGNQLAVMVEQDEEGFVVRTMLQGAVMDEQRTSDVSALKDNAFVSFSGQGTVTAASGGYLAGGTDEKGTKDEYKAFLTALESVEFNAFCLPGGDEQTKGEFAAAAKRFIEEQGKLAQCVLWDYEGDAEYVTNVVNGVVLKDGTVIDKSLAVAWVCGAAASAGPAGSLTNMDYEGAVGPDVVFTDAQIKAALKAGKLLFVPTKNLYGTAVATVEQDVNSLTSLTENRPECWRKNRIVRALYYLVNSLSRVWRLYYKGKVDNNASGRALFKADLITLMKTLVEMGAYEEFDGEKDITIERGESVDSVVCKLAVKPVDAMEKMYFTVEVN